MQTSLASDFRHALRGLMRAPTVTFAAILCLGLGIGATTAIYSAVNTALLAPLPFAAPDRLVTVLRTTPHFESGPFSPANFLDLREAATSLEGLGAVTTQSGLLQYADASVRVSVNPASGDVFALLGVEPVRGRLIQRADEAEEQPLVVVISEELWRERFGSDAGIIGRRVHLDGVEHEVIGVLPRAFRMPHGNNVLSADAWVPLRLDAQQATLRRSNYLMLMGRLRPGVSVEAAHAELYGIMAGIVESFPELRGEQLRVVPMHRESVRSVRGPLFLLMGAVTFVLLIAAANVASLLLARGVGRRTEYALRSVLGANRSAVLRPSLLESGLLALAGALVGVGLAWSGVALIRTLLPARLPQLAGLSIDATVLAFALAVAMLVSVLCGVAPAWQASRTDAQEALRASGRTGRGRGHQTFLRVLVAAEVGLSLVLLLGAGLVLRGFQTLVRQDPGFDPSRLLTLSVHVAPDRYPDGAIDNFLAPALERMRALSGVEGAGVISLIPYVNWGWNFNIRYEGQPGDDPSLLPLVENRVVSPSYFEAMGIDLVRGRLLTEQDGPDGLRVVVANQALIDRDFAGQDPIGKRFHVSDTAFATIVGVVANVKNFGPDRPPQPEVYQPLRQANAGATVFPFVVRVSGDPVQYASAVSAAILEVDPSAAISSVRAMEDVMATSMGRPRFYLALLAIFAVVALLLALAGLYGVMSYVVAQRTRELGIRSALGSTPSRTIGLVMRQGMGLVALGTFFGLAGAFAVTRLLGSLLYGVSPLDLATWAAVPALLIAVAALATAIPARRASGVEPLIAIRAE